MKTITCVLTALMLLSAGAAFAQRGSLDSSFGSNGKIQTISDGRSSVAIQADGKILVTGTNYFGVERFTKKGKIDKNFGNKGRASTSFEAYGYGLHAIRAAVQPGGKIIVAGSVWNGDFFETHLCLARFNTDGLLDSSFGINGHVETTIGQNANEDVSDLIIQPDGKIIVTIWEFMNFYQGRTAAIRFNADGAEDTYFGVDFSLHDLCYALCLQSDGKIVVTGSTINKSGEVFALFRYNQSGWIDRSFGDSGLTTLHNQPGGLALAAKQDDKIIAITNDSILAQFQKDGIADTSFGKKGKVSTPFQGNAVAIQADGKIIITGSINNGTDNDFALARYKENGKPDKTFGINGIVTSDFGSSEEGNALAIQKNGKIVVSGSGYLARYIVTAGSFDNNSIISSNIISQDLSAGLRIYPNPIQSILNIEFNKTGAVQKRINIYDVSGKLLISKLSNDNTTLNVKQLMAGTYLIKITEADGKLLYNGKVVKQ